MVKDARQYRVEVVRDDPDTPYERDYGNNLKAAQAFARRETRALDASAYVIRKTKGKDDGQWFYFNGMTYGLETM